MATKTYKKIDGITKVFIFMHVVSLVLFVVMGALMYTMWFQLDLVDKGSVEDVRRLSTDIANQRECLKRHDFDCPSGKYVK